MTKVDLLARIAKLEMQCVNTPVTPFRPSSWTGIHEEKHPPASSQLQKTVPENSPQRPHPGLAQNTPSTPSVSRTRELQRMHHWTLKTCSSFSLILREVFQTYVVEQALPCPFLMDALLALTSFHMAAELPIHSSAKAEFLGDALQYQSRSLPAFRIEL